MSPQTAQIQWETKAADVALKWPDPGMEVWPEPALQPAPLPPSLNTTGLGGVGIAQHECAAAPRNSRQTTPDLPTFREDGGLL